MKNGLSQKSLEVYEIIKRYSLENKWVSMRELAELTNLTERIVRRHISDIREYEGNDKIIISGDKGYKILSSEEEFSYLTSRKISLLKSLKQYYKDVNRYNKNNSFKINISKQELEIIETFGL